MKIAVLERDSVSGGDIDFSHLESVAEIIYYGKTDNKNLINTIIDCDGILVNKTVIDKNVIDNCHKLRYIGLFATGYNNIDTEYAKKKGITVCNVAGYSTDAVAQHVFAFILYTASSLGKYLSSVSVGDWKKCDKFCYYPFKISEIKGKTLGIIGYGSIGKRVAEIAAVFGMRVIVNSRTVSDSGAVFLSKEEVFKESDWLTLHCPLTSQTEKLVNSETLALMKDTAVLINTARGGIVDEYALREALINKKISAACVDTLASEPMRPDCPLFGIDNCYITPHVAWAATETRQRLVDKAADNIKNYLAGNPTNVVN